ncbi:MAG TPA: GNAT family N-acetyltransferase [Ktedonobacterales bacterium]|nr:GNAT family N-acetyltransferase [Ktedonobacterales bacterium]
MAMTSASPADLIRVGMADTRRAAETLARAFQDDPLMRYVMPDGDERHRLLPWLIGLNVRYGCRYGEVYATRGYTGCAVWLPPGQTRMTLWRMMRAGMLVAPLRMRWPILRRLALAGNHAAALHERCAPGPHWYLSQLGVEPSQQRQGIASRLLRPMLARIDATALPCYLETENPANVAFYQRHGFRVVAEQAWPGGEPGIWAMLRVESGEVNWLT